MQSFIARYVEKFAIINTHGHGALFHPISRYA